MEERKKELLIQQEKNQREEKERLKQQAWIYEKKNVIPIVKVDTTANFDPNDFLDDFSDKSDSGEMLGVKRQKTKRFEMHPTYLSGAK